MTQAGHVARMGEMEVNTRFWLKTQRIKERLENVGEDRRVTLKCIFKTQLGSGLDLSGSGKAQASGTCECGNEPPGSIKYGNFLTS
jgi:hypothetical protein